MALILPLDLQHVLVNTLSGSFQIFIILAFFSISALSARFKMPNSIAMLMFALFGIFMASYVPDLYFLIVLIAGISIFYGIGALVKR